MTDDSLNQNREIIENYFDFRKDPDGSESSLPIQAAHLIAEVESEGKLPQTDYKIVNADLTVSNLTVSLGFTAEENIAALVVSLNKLGFRTNDSCEGHTDRGQQFARIGFWGSELYKVLALVKDYGKEQGIDDFALIAGQGVEDSHHAYFSLCFITGNLQSSRHLAREFSVFIDSKMHP